MRSISPTAVQKPTPANFPEFLPYACGQLSAPFGVSVKVKVQDEYVSKAEDKTKKGKKSMAVLQHKSASDVVTSGLDAVAFTDYDDDEIKVTAVVDSTNQLIGISMHRSREAPRLIFQILGLCVPFCSYLTSLVLDTCALTGCILHEIAKFLPQSQITEISLDNSPIVASERIYYMLLERQTNLRNLSLARCNLSDQDCTVLFAQLLHPLPASKTLMTLNLTSNFISDRGARAIGDCLRSNRTLQYLNLAGNYISDDGAVDILQSCIEFPLTADEIMKKKQRFMDYLKMRQNVYNRFVKEITNTLTGKAFDEFSKTSKRKALKGKDNRTPSFSQLPKNLSAGAIATTKAEMMTEEFVGRYTDPFSMEETVFRDRYIYSIGNLVLCSLNLAYNNLGYVTVKKLLEVMKYQKSLNRNSAVGLLYVQLQGNNLPMCVETNILLDYLEQAVIARMQRMQSPRRDKSRIRKL
ncbi:uncharacterized protein LOC132901862 [Amyelois transitella]|uniref:uncharacterized protein LOC132901862 n=1 Tax=Amyelois transitella TaxID=680683 RepID=UPI0029906381|nr:uncharacterized protein LOC132901862 [Amyelois transitella]